MIIYPAVDILDGKCVRLIRGQYSQVTLYHADPVEAAKRWEADGAEILHVVDLDGAASGQPKNLKVVEKIINSVNVPLQLGGGIRDLPTLEILLELGVHRVVLGTSLITSSQFVEEICPRYGRYIAAGLDAREGKIAISGWQEETSYEVVELAREIEKLGVSRLIYTDISVDGTQAGLNIDSIKALVTEVMVPVIASGGVAGLDDIIKLKELEVLGVEGVIIGRALYEGNFTLKDAIKAAT